VPAYRGRVAVVTGAASGIGYAVASRAAAEGMTVVLADIDAAALHGAAASLRGIGADVRPYGVDVSDRESVMDLARRVREEVGDGPRQEDPRVVDEEPDVAEMPLAQWEFIVGVNFWGVVHCLHAFLPGMVGRDSGHV